MAEQLDLFREEPDAAGEIDCSLPFFPCKGALGFFKAKEGGSAE